MYVAQNYYRGSYKKPQWGLEQTAPVGAWGKANEWAPVLGAAAGVGKTIYENWNTIRPFIQGVAEMAA